MPASRFTTAHRFRSLPATAARLARWLVCAAALLAPLAAAQAAARNSTISEQPTRALILLAPGSSLEAAAAQLSALGGVVYAAFPERALYAWLTPAQAETARRLLPVAVLALAGPAARPLSPDLAADDPGARAALLAWNAGLAQAPQADLRADPHTDPYAVGQARQPDLQAPALQVPDNPVLLPPDHSPRRSFAVGRDHELGPDATQTSEYMLGSLQVDVFLPESNGQLDADSETWTAAQIDRVLAEVTQGVSWWAEAALLRRSGIGDPGYTAGDPGYSAAADLTTNLVFHTPLHTPAEVATRYEPVSRPSWDEGLWIGEIMGRLGYSQPSYFSAVRQYAHDRRTALHTDWSVVIWVVNSAADPDGRFANGHFGYSYLFGPFVVMTIDNSGWSLDNLDLVTAHELAHAFGALDEYAASGCMDTQTGGYLNTANTNCENGSPASEDSIMRSAYSQRIAFPNHRVSTPARHMLGWRDSDFDGIYDPLDTIPEISPDGGSPAAGLALDVPWTSDTRLDASINPIVGVDYRLEGGEWHACQALDGHFDALMEAYTCPVDAAAAGVQVRAVNRMGMDSTMQNPGAAPYSVYLPAAFGP